MDISVNNTVIQETEKEISYVVNLQEVLDKGCSDVERIIAKFLKACPIDTLLRIPLSTK